MVTLFMTVRSGLHALHAIADAVKDLHPTLDLGGVRHAPDGRELVATGLSRSWSPMLSLNFEGTATAMIDLSDLAASAMDRIAAVQQVEPVSIIVCLSYRSPGGIANESELSARLLNAIVSHKARLYVDVLV